MESQPALNLIPTIQQAIGNLLTTHEPEFLAFGSRLFMALATIVLAWQGIQATQDLAKSPNAKVIVIGPGKNGLPIILGGKD